MALRKWSALLLEPIETLTAIAVYNETSSKQINKYTKTSAATAQWLNNIHVMFDSRAFPIAKWGA